MLKIDFLSIFFKKFNKPSIQFLRVWTKNTNSLEILRRFSKILKRFLKKIAKNALFTLAPAGIFRGGGGSEVHQGRACKGVAAWVVPDGRRRSFQKNCKKINEKFTFFKKFSRKFPDFFQKFFTILQNFGRKFGENLRKFRNTHLQGVRGTKPPTLANLWKSEQKNQWKPAMFGQF